MRDELLNNARFEVAMDLYYAINAFTYLTRIFNSCTNDEERANVQKLIDEVTEEARQLGDRLLQISGSPEVVGNA